MADARRVAGLLAQLVDLRHDLRRDVRRAERQQQHAGQRRGRDRRDLWQYAQSPTPCLTLQGALQAVQAAPHVDNVDALKAAAPPLMPVGAAASSVEPLLREAEKTACRDVDPLLANVRTAYAAAFPDKFKTKKKRPKKRRR